MSQRLFDALAVPARRDVFNRTRTPVPVADLGTVKSSEGDEWRHRLFYDYNADSYFVGHDNQWKIGAGSARRFFVRFLHEYQAKHPEKWALVEEEMEKHRASLKR